MLKMVGKPSATIRRPELSQTLVRTSLGQMQVIYAIFSPQRRPSLAHS